MFSIPGQTSDTSPEAGPRVARLSGARSAYTTAKGLDCAEARSGAAYISSLDPPPTIAYILLQALGHLES
jgi:hypothetical protein